jgi:hypothetical protein
MRAPCSDLRPAELDLERAAVASSSPLEIASSQSGHLWEAYQASCC